jgi:large subunit ribosomal protein L10
MRPEKALIVSDLSEKLMSSPFLLVTDYQRMKVDQFGELRNRLAPTGAEVHVIKNSFLKRAMADSGFPDVADKLTGQTAVVTGRADVAPVAKILKTFAAEFKIATLKIGVIDREVLTTADVEALADLPARDVLLAQLLGVLLAPATKLVRVLNEPASSLARLLQAKATKDGANAKVAKEEAKADSVAVVPPEAQASAEPVAAASAPNESNAAEPKTESTEGEAPAAEAAGS